MSFLDRLSAAEDAIYEKHEQEMETRLKELYETYPQLTECLFNISMNIDDLKEIISINDQIKIIHTYCICNLCPNQNTYCSCDYCKNQTSDEFLVNKVISSGIRYIDIIDALIKAKLKINCKHNELVSIDNINHNKWQTTFYTN